MTAKEILQKARKLITEPGSWIQGNYAQDVDGKSVNEENEKAVCYCSSGALNAAAHQPGQTWEEHQEVVLYRRNAKAALNTCMSGNIILFNDRIGRTHEEVLTAFDRAIDLVE